MKSSLTEWLIQHYGREEMKKEAGLARIRKALEPILKDLSQKKIITIAGTNGKGETTLWLSKDFKNRPHCVWISPHIERLTERFRDENGEISSEELQKLIQECHEVVQKNKYELTYYEFLFFVFCHWAHKSNTEYLLLEVGLGGRLDAVNIFDADIVLLPSISRDHQEFLGNRYDKILSEKLALLREKTLLLSFLSLNYLREKSQEIVGAVGARQIDLEEASLAKSWEFSRRNQLLARAAFLKVTGTEEKVLLNTLKNTPLETYFLEHRGEVMNAKGEWIFYGSHNVDGLRNLIQFLDCGTYNFTRPPYDAVLVAFSRRDTGDLQTMLKMLKASGLGNIVVTTFSHPKALPGDVIESLAVREGMNFVPDPGSYIQNSISSNRTLVTGSYYFMGHIKQILRGR